MDEKVTPVIGREQVIKHLMQLRKTLVHSLNQPRIGPRRFNEIREQLLPLDAQLRKLGIDDLPVTPQMQPSFVKQSRYERRKHQRDGKFNSYESRIAEKRARKRQLELEDANN